jgi:hypothetical protein
MQTVPRLILTALKRDLFLEAVALSKKVGPQTANLQIAG